MSSTNKTTNYELSQFIGTDKPAWLTDYNADMGKIDTAIKGAKDAGDGAQGTANTNTSAIGDLTNLTTTAKNNLVAAVNEVKSAASTAQSTASSASSTANLANTKATQADNKVDALTAKFNLTATTYSNATGNGRSISSNASFGSGAYYVAKNSDGSLLKVYADASITVRSTGAVTITLPISNFTVQSTFNIVSAGFAVLGDGTNIKEVPTINLEIQSGKALIKFNAPQTGLYKIAATPFLIFNTNFGDLPE